MAAGISHEIANPLTAVTLGSSQARALLARGVSDPAQMDKVLERIERSGFRIQKIIQGMRTLSRDGKGDPLVPYSLSQVVEETLSICSARFRTQGILLEVPPAELPSGQEPNVLCRPVQLGQIVLNLLNNAYDAVQGRPDPWVRLSIRIEGSMGVLEVSDSGPDIAPEVAAKIMQPFFTTKVVGKGTGLGLSISQKIAADHGGSLELDRSRSNTTFVLRIPLLTS
jgi:C4-dicarboxylate-specific signal transduction histidine kinase